MSFSHYSVLLQETIDGLNVNKEGIYLDCTLGGAGHASYLLSKLEGGHLYAFDQDLNAIENAQKVLAPYVQTGKVTFIHANFRTIKEQVHQLGLSQVDGIYYDLGVSSPQLDHAERGFSYHQDAPLDMRMDQTAPYSAYDLVNQATYEELVKIIFRYGEEKFAKSIARNIERERQKEPIKTTGQLAEIVKHSIPAAKRRTGGHPAKRTFQAIRIAVNDELGALEESMQDAVNLLKPGGRISVITFHSLEDRFVKQYFKELSTPPQVPANLPVLPSQVEADYRLVSRKPILPSEVELGENNRSRSAKLRIIEKLK